jgi:glycoside/pentoside/hexuronide:cation symporter, GPH family
MLAVRVSDVFTDPFFGYIADRFPTPWGRRRFWIVLSTPIMMLSVYQLFLPPEGAGAWHMGIWMFALSIATTMMIIPYYAWAAELSPDYNERSKITGVRSMMGVVGSLAAQLGPVIAAFFFAMTGAPGRWRYDAGDHAYLCLLYRDEGARADCVR